MLPPAQWSCPRTPQTVHRTHRATGVVLLAESRQPVHFITTCSQTLRSHCSVLYFSFLFLDCNQIRPPHFLLNAPPPPPLSSLCSPPSLAGNALCSVLHGLQGCEGTSLTPGSSSASAPITCLLSHSCGASKSP